MKSRIFALSVIGSIALTSAAWAQTPSGPPEDVEVVIEESKTETEQPVSIIDRPIYREVQKWKKEISEKYGIDWALEDTLIYQNAGGSVDPNDAMVNTLGLFATWKIFRSENQKDFAGFGFQGEIRCNPVNEFTALRDDLGTLWSVNDSTSDDYTKYNQLWWGQRFGDGKFGYLLGKIDPGSRINGNRFAGSGNTQFFGQPYATNPARSFPDNGLGFILQAAPVEWVEFLFQMSDSDAISTHSPFTTIEGNWAYAGEVAFKPKLEGLGKGTYRFMLYQRDAEAASEFGWAISADQNLSDDFGVFLRYGGNDGDLNAIEHLVSGGVAFLQPFERKNDQAGVGLSWTRPSDTDLRDEYAGEVYYRLQVTDGFEISASTQYIIDPSAGDDDSALVFGVRARLLY